MGDRFQHWQSSEAKTSNAVPHAEVGTFFVFFLITVKQLMSENFSWACGRKPGDQKTGGACS